MATNCPINNICLNTDTRCSVILAQARQAYLAGNKALAKELSAKGQWHNEQMKAAHSKAGEAIFWQR